MTILDQFVESFYYQGFARSLRANFFEGEEDKLTLQNGRKIIRGNKNRGNRPERFREGNLPLRGSLLLEVFRGLGFY